MGVIGQFEISFRIIFNGAYQLKMKKSNNLAAVALANKITRIAWAMLVNQSEFAYKQAM